MIVLLLWQQRCYITVATFYTFDMYALTLGPMALVPMHIYVVHISPVCMLTSITARLCYHLATHRLHYNNTLFTIDFHDSTCIQITQCKYLAISHAGDIHIQLRHTIV